MTRPINTRAESKPHTALFAIPMWLVVLGWWAFLAQALFRLPAPDPAQSVATPQPATAPPPSSSEAPVEQPPNGLPPATIPSPPAAAPAPSADDPAVSRAELLMHTRHVASCLLAEDAPMAIAYIDREIEYAQSAATEVGLAQLKRLTEQIAMMDGLISDAFHQKLGQQVTVYHKGAPRTLLVRRASDGKVEGEMTVHAEGAARSVSFLTRDLDPLERSRWLGDPSSPDRCAMKFILHAMAKDFETAKAYAGNCGVLSDVFRKLAESELQGAAPSP